jgi:hypothetical protein
MVAASGCIWSMGRSFGLTMRRAPVILHLRRAIAKATVGIVESLLALLHDPAEAVRRIAVVFDNPIRSFRNDLFPPYKSDAGVPPELRSQFGAAEDAVCSDQFEVHHEQVRGLQGKVQLCPDGTTRGNSPDHVHTESSSRRHTSRSATPSPTSAATKRTRWSLWPRHSVAFCAEFDARLRQIHPDTWTSR